MTNITYKCPACGGALRYSPAERKFSREYCGNSWDNVAEKLSAKEIKTGAAADDGSKGGSTPSLVRVAEPSL